MNPLTYTSDPPNAPKLWIECALAQGQARIMCHSEQARRLAELAFLDALKEFPRGTVVSYHDHLFRFSNGAWLQLAL